MNHHVPPFGMGVVRAADAIKQAREKRISNFVGLLDEENPDDLQSNPFYGYRRIQAQVAADYADRFVHELLQNGHDAHPSERTDGVLRICFAPDLGPFGTVLAANGGRGFGFEELRGICDAGCSSKPPGQAIGNKGLGFRSVAQITDDPRIHSSRVPGLDDGLKFRFASKADHPALFKAKHQSAAAKALPLFYLPLLLDESPPVVENLLASGFATVVELPLKSAAARETALSELNRLRSASQPFLLFLPRVRSLRLDVLGQEPVEFTRDITALADDVAGSLRIADLGRAGRWAVASRSIPAPAMTEAIRADMASGLLGEGWEDWTGPGETAVAVRLDAPLKEPLLHAYLATEAPAPVSAHVHGSFSPKADRTAVSRAMALNRLVLESAADLAGWAARAVPSLPPNVLPAGERAAAAIDFLAWTSDPVDGRRSVPSLRQRAGTAARTQAGDLLVPVIDRATGDLGWNRAQSAVSWPAGRTVLDARAAARSRDLHVLWSGLDAGRVGRLEAFLQIVLGRKLQPDTAVLKAVVSSEAAHLRAVRAGAERWRAFLDDVGALFRDRPSALVGTAFLPCADGTVRAPVVATAAADAGRRRRGRRAARLVGNVMIFTPRKGTGGRGSVTSDLELALPAELRDGFAMLDPRLDWFGKGDDTRRFLEANNLTRPEEDGELIRQVNRVARVTDTVAARRAALRWCFALWKSRRPAMGEHTVEVPTRSGRWIPARQAVFGAGWPSDTEGDAVAEYVELAAGAPSVARLAERLLAPPSDPAFKPKNGEAWAEFLRAVLVPRGLSEEDARSSGERSIPGSVLVDLGIGKSLGLSEEAMEVWRRACPDRSFRVNGRYTVQGRFAIFPGQEIHAQLSPRAKELHAQLLLSRLALLPPEALTLQFAHDFYTRLDRPQLPTPLSAHLSEAAWIPTVSGPPRRPRDLWFGPVGDPGYVVAGLPRPAPSLKAALASEATVAALCRLAAARRVDDVRRLPRLAEELAEAAVATSDEFVRGDLVRHHDDAWRHMVSAGTDPSAGQ